MKIIFLGTPEFSRTVLEIILKSHHTVSAVVTQPDKTGGRNKKIIFSEVKNFALKNNLALFQFNNISRDGEQILKDIDADIMVTAAYGQILRENILNICKHGVINVHASILPFYRGASPVQWALINGEKTVGATIMQTDIGIDTGDIIKVKKINLEGDENADDVLSILANIGAEALIEALDDIENGQAVFLKQDESKATHCRMLTKQDGLINFKLTAEEVVNFIRGVTPWPGAFCDSDNGRLKFLKAEAVMNSQSLPCGTVITADLRNGLTVACGKDAVRVLSIQGENAKVMDTKSYLLGKKLILGSVLRGK